MQKRLMMWVKSHRVAIMTCPYVIYILINWAISIRMHDLDSDFTIMAEVARRIANGAVLYVDAIDQKGPAVYYIWAMLWHVAKSYTQMYAIICTIKTACEIASVWLIAKILDEHDQPISAALLLTAMLCGYAFDTGPATMELRALALAMWCALMTTRTVRGKTQPSWMWLLLGIGIGYILCSKWPCCIAFVACLAWGIAKSDTKAFARPLALSLTGCAVVTAICAVMLVRDGSWQGFIEHSVRASDMTYITNIVSKSAAGVTGLHVFKLPIIMMGILSVTRPTATMVKKRSLAHMALAIVNLATLLLGAIALLIGYYDLNLIAPIVLALADTDLDQRLRERGQDAALMTASVIIVWFLATSSLMTYSNLAYMKQDDIIRAEYDDIYAITGDDTSITSNYFNVLPILAREGLTTPYAMPLPNNVKGSANQVEQDLRQARWHYLLKYDIGKTSDAKVGDTKEMFGQTWTCRYRGKTTDLMLWELDADTHNTLECTKIDAV